MSDIDFSKIRVSPIMDSLVIDKITDEVYFSEKYADYISNSRLKLINPDQGGSPEQYFEQNLFGCIDSRFGCPRANTPTRIFRTG